MSENKLLTYDEVWKTLSKIDVKPNTEKKNGLTYLSWSWAWGLMMEHYPQARYEFYQDDNNLPYVTFPDGTAEIRCKIHIDNLSREMWLPVISYKNAPIIKPNAFQINNSKMRCLTKCIAIWGLGHRIYAGEDIPIETEDTSTEAKNKNSTSEGLKDAWLDGILDKLSPSPRDIAQAVTTQICITLKEKKSIKGINNVWNSRSNELKRLENFPDLYSTVVDAYENHKMELEERKVA